jgi:Flp pilus assembly protein TadB
MTIRRLAFSILNRAIRRAPAEFHEWGKAMLNEMEAIESDWAAFRWAVGGALALIRGCELPIKDLSEVPARMEALEKSARRRYLPGYAACFFVIASFVRFLFYLLNPLQRAGSILTILGSGFLVYQLELNRRQRKAAAGAMGGTPVPCEHYRAILERLRDFHRGRTFWSRMIVFLPGPLLFLVGSHVVYPQLLSPISIDAAIFIALGILAIPLNLKLARKYQRQIDQLDRLQEK